MPDPDPSANGYRQPAAGGAGLGSPQVHAGRGLVLTGTVSMFAWISGAAVALVVISIRSIDGASAWDDGALRFALEMGAAGAALGSWAGAWAALQITQRGRLSGGVRAAGTGAVAGVAFAAALGALGASDTAAGAALLQIASLPLVGPLVALAAILAPGLGAALGTRFAETRRPSPT